MYHMYGFLIHDFPACLRHHFPNHIISQTIHVETVHHTACGRETDTCVCSIFKTMSRVISLTIKRICLESFSRTDVTVLTYVPFTTAIMLSEHPLRIFVNKSMKYKKSVSKHLFVLTHPIYLNNSL